MQTETQGRSDSLAGCLQWVAILGLLGWLSAVPVAVMALVSAATGYAPKAIAMLGGVASPGSLPTWAIGALATAVTLLLELILFLPAWLFTRKRAGWEWLAGVSTGLVLVSVYQALWAVGGIPFDDAPAAAAVLRIALTWPFLLAVLWVSRSFEALRRPSLPTLLLAAGVAACLLIPWLILGALGTLYFTLASLARALVNGVGEELVFRGLLMLWLTRGAGRKQTWLAAFVSLLVYTAAQPAYVLPLGDWFVLFGRPFVAMAVGLLAAEFFARGSLWPAMLVHVAYEFGSLAFADWRVQASTPHPALMMSLGIALILGLALWLGRWMWNKFHVSRFTFHIIPSLPRDVLRLAASGGFAVLTVVAALAAYLFWGHPGFYHDGVLIILREQADVSKAYTITDRVERIRYVYDTLTETANRTQAPLWAELDKMGVDYRPYYLVNMIRVDDLNDLSLGWLKTRLAGRDDVAEVILNPNIRQTRHMESMSMLGVFNEPQGVEWNIRAVKANQAWDELGVTGEGVVVADADTGVDWTHPALQAHYRGWNGSSAAHDYNWYDPWDDAPEPWDEHGHGTHTTGTMVGDDGAGNQVGVAPGAQWVACRNMRAGLGNPGAYTACMEFFLAPFPRGGDPFRDGKPEQAPHVINNSWGCPTFEGCAPDTLKRAVENLRAAGIMMVVSAGNDGPGCGTVKDPAAIYDASFTVGAEGASGQVTSFSSRGPAAGQELLKPDVTAPGENVRSAVPGGGYMPSPGTSMAGPHVAGLVALIWSANPTLAGDIERTEDIIRRTAQPRRVETVCDLEKPGSLCACGDDAPGKVPNNVYGYGLIDAYEAVKEAMRQ
ncbi:MAG: S8 family serine peptidase [Thermoflexales bacterium]|nr:S8 family serine peptidase [Thermoflexales bacterium]